MSRTKYTREHHWIRGESDGTCTVGLSPFALEQLGEIVSVELPSVGARLERGDEAVVVESSKSVVEVAMPASGVVVAVNEPLAGEPALLNEDPTGRGWLFRLRPDGAAPPECLDEEEYLRLVRLRVRDELA